ncbi:cytochrome c biogenesis CcdA family protein [Lagierella sp.]|uniref:cytochrome c biogenesis CcdA family protein n=1 Tax=Lagierella sp. TaxID=2849657 RepID=UPI0026086B34|nr:cytochrome c biogenesis CcdA family protein [Lagierella sp.]
MINSWLSQLALIIGDNPWIAPVLSLIAGALTSLTPCSLSTIPLIISYVSGLEERDSKRAFKYSVIFAIGMAITFVGLSIIAVFAGMLIGTTSRLWYIILGVLMILMALQTWGIYEIIPSRRLMLKDHKRGSIGAFIAGVVGGFFSSPCSTPVLVALLGILSRTGNILWGIFLMLMYSIGHSFLVILSGTSVGYVKRMKNSRTYSRVGKVLNTFLGFLVLLIGFYMFWNAF